MSTTDNSVKHRSSINNNNSSTKSIIMEILIAIIVHLRLSTETPAKGVQDPYMGAALRIAGADCLQ